MDSTLRRHDNLMPQPPGGTGKGAALALLVHVGLIVALAFGVAWRSQTPSGVSAELWAAVPQIAAPPAVEPPKPKPTPTPTPPPPAVKAEEPPPKPAQIDPQIAIEKEKAERKLREQREQREQQERERKERERLEQEKAEKLAAQKQRELEAKRQKEEEARQAKQREENLKRILGQAGTGTAPTGTAARDAGPSANYAGRIVARVKPNIVLTDEVPGNPLAIVEVRCAPDGMIIGRRLVQSSGNKDWDNAVLRAIDRTEVLPRDTDGTVPSPMQLDFRPRD